MFLISWLSKLGPNLAVHADERTGPFSKKYKGRGRTYICEYWRICGGYINGRQVTPILRAELRSNAHVRGGFKERPHGELKVEEDGSLMLMKARCVRRLLAYRGG